MIIFYSLFFVLTPDMNDMVINPLNEFISLRANTKQTIPAIGKEN